MKHMNLLPLLWLLSGCGTDSSTQVAGTGSQTGNSVVAGRLLRSDKDPIAGAPVTARPSGWTVDSSLDRVFTTTTDSHGRWMFEEVPEGVWRFETNANNLAWARNVRIAGRDSTLPDVTCLRPGNLVVEIHFDDDDLHGGRLAVQGTNIRRELPATGFETYVALNELPAGTHWLILISREGEIEKQARAIVRERATDTLRNTSWTTVLEEPGEDHEEPWEPQP
ncbi:MAG: carboxypeptidase regulatory-like domain-containing protein [Fibrobacteria bacterium]|nr:carboxypeptidase regulatory-like domain-containing protein [Fibrobacteria bacterium]